MGTGRIVADMVVIGSGQGGVPLAASYAEEGRTVVLFERSAVGGTCVNYGCQPSKAFLASAHAAAAARNAGALGVTAQVTVDGARVMERTREVIEGSRDGVRDRLVNAGVRLVDAEAAFVDETTVQGGDVQVSAPVIVLNTGKSSVVPPLPGLDSIDYLTYESFWQLRDLPRRILVIGGGYVGVELGQGLARLGCETTIVDRSERIVDREEEDVSRILTRALEADGARIHSGRKIERIRPRSGVIDITLDSAASGDSEDALTLSVDAVLVATGRKANTASLNADTAGIELDERGHVRVDAEFRTSNPRVYAIGDVTGQPEFTHVSWEDYRRLRSVLDGGGRRRGDRVLGYAFFTEPEVGRVGLTLQQAREQGYDAKATTMSLENVSRARLSGAGEGFYRMVIDRKSDRILGATLVGPAAGELLHVFMAYMEAGATWHVLEQSVHVHPTFAEGLPTLARQFADD